jgi:hypothetical protein
MTIGSVAVVVAITGCSSSGSPDTPTPDTPTTVAATGTAPPSTASAPASVTTVSTSTSTTAPAPPVTDLTRRLADAGIDCNSQQLVGDVKCTWQGQEVTVSTTPWTQDAALRKKACDEGYINAGYAVATDGAALTVAADQNEDAQAIAQALGIQIKLYCP